MEAIKSRIKNVVETHFEGTDCFLVDIKVSPKQKIQVFVDEMSKNVDLQVCVSLSRQLETILEEEGLVNEKYVLEVSSPGMSNPFKVFKQYQKNLGRNVEVLFKDGTKIEGILKKVEEQTFEIEEHIPKKKGKIPQQILHQVQFEEIKSVKKKITF